MIIEIITGIVLCIIGIIFSFIGFLLWKKEKISLMHDYHYDKVSEENKKAFCTLCGIGMIIIGIGILLTGIIIMTTASPLGFIAFGAGFIPGLSLMIYATNKYNK